MWGLAIAIYAGCKLLTWGARTVDAPVWKQVAYLVAWPGMDCDAYLAGDRNRVCRPSFAEWATAIVTICTGAVVLWGLVPMLPSEATTLQARGGMLGVILVLHFGVFALLSCFWRSRGVAAMPLMHQPLRSKNLADFWGRRWNTAFRDLTHQFLFRSLRRLLGAPLALVAGFAASGLVHDVVISGPSGGGWGMPTAYFMIQGGALLVQRTQWLHLADGLTGRMYCLAIVVGPSPLLFHTPFRERVMVPFLAAIGALA